jgi:transmembrane sensor
MSQRETPEAIDEAAAAWVARIDRAPLSPAEDAELDAWLANDSRRRGAFAKANAVMIYADRARPLGPAYDDGENGMFIRPLTPDRPRESTRRWTLAAGGAAAAAMVGAAVGIGYEAWRPAQRFETGRGELRRLPLADGTLVTLNTATKVAVKFTTSRRDVQLIEGEALFDVAKNLRRPFYVDAGDIRVRAVGTSFTVRKLSGKPTEVLVSEGIVEVTRSDGRAVGPVRLFANQQVLARPNAPFTPTVLAPAALARELMWRQGMLSFAGASLREAAAEFSRYSDPQIAVDDPTIANETITGLFSANDPAGFAQAVALSLNLSTRTEDGKIHISR